MAGPALGSTLCLSLRVDFVKLTTAGMDLMAGVFDDPETVLPDESIDTLG